MNGRHWIPLGVVGAAVFNRSPLDVVLLGFEQEANKVRMGKHSVGRRCGVVGMLSNEELGVPEPERVMSGVGTALAVSVWLEEEEEGDPSEVADCNISLVGSLGSSVQGLVDDDREGPHSCWRRILLLIGYQMTSKPKFEFPHAVVAWVVGPHRCEYLTDRAEVLLVQLILDR